MRIVSGPIANPRVHYEAPPRERLEGELLRFLGGSNAPPADLDGLLRAGLAHGWFELTHPFEDGNGRIGRALLDRALAQDEQRAQRLYGLSSRLMAVRDDYDGALESLSVGDLDVTAWLGWFLEQVAIAAQASERPVDQVVRTARFWMRHGALPLNDRQRKALNALLDAGPAGSAGGLTNRKDAHPAHTSPAIAQRDLADLTARGLRVTSGAGRSVRYTLAALPECTATTGRRCVATERLTTPAPDADRPARIPLLRSTWSPLPVKTELARLLIAALQSLEGTLVPSPIDPEWVSLERTRDAAPAASRAPRRRLARARAPARAGTGLSRGGS